MNKTRVDEPLTEVKDAMAITDYSLGIDADSIPHSISVISDWLAEEIRRGLVARGYRDISPNQAPLLRIVSNNSGEISMTALAQASQKSKPLITQMVTGLEHTGYLRRYKSDTDKRVVLVGITPKGRQAQDDIAGMIAEIVKTRFVSLSHEELWILAILLNKVSCIFQ